MFSFCLNEVIIQTPGNAAVFVITSPLIVKDSLQYFVCGGQDDSYLTKRIVISIQYII